MAYGFANAYTTTLNGAIDSSVTSLAVSSDLPSALVVPFMARIDNEYFRVTAVSGTGNRTWTVTRAAEESTRFPAASHSNGASVNHVLTGAALRTFQIAPRARVNHNTSQTAATGGFTTLAFNSERKDTDGFHDTATNNSRLTVPSGLGGGYIMGGHVDFDTASTTGKRALGIRVNGTTFIAYQEIPGASSARKISLTTEYDLADGDYIELLFWQDSGGTRTIESNANTSPEFWIARLGD